MSRHTLLTQKVPTPFGKMYIHIEVGDDGAPTGGWISHPEKDPESQIRMLMEALSEGLNEACKIG